MHFYGQFKDHSSGRNHENQTNDLIFSSTFYSLTVCNNHFCENSFSCGPPFGSFWSVKYLNFGQELLIGTVHHIFQESRHPESTEDQCYVLSPEGSQKKASAHGVSLKNSIQYQGILSQICLSRVSTTSANLQWNTVLMRMRMGNKNSKEHLGCITCKITQNSIYKYVTFLYLIVRVSLFQEQTSLFQLLEYVVNTIHTPVPVQNNSVFLF